MESVKNKTFSHCFVCTESCKRSRSTKLIEKSQAPLSKKSIKSLLIYLAKFIKIDLNIPADALVCPTCFQCLVEYDEYVVKLLESQQHLTALIEKSVKERGEVASCSSSSNIPIDNITTVTKEEICDDIETFSDLVESVYDEEEAVAMSEIDFSMIVSDKEENENGDDDDDDDEFVPDPNYPQLVTGEYACAHCEQLFKNKTRLKRHMNAEHKSRKRVTCTICGVMVRDEEYLDLHMNLHNGKTETECRYCSKQYTRKVNVIRHMQKHWNNKKFQCEKCGERFSETPVLYNHRLQHEAEEEPLICPTCSQCFKTKRTYKSHLMTHREDRPRFSCEYCGKTFVEKYTLKVHRRVHGVDGGVNASSGGRKSNSKAKDKSISNETQAVINCIICDCKFVNKEQHMMHMEQEHDVIQ